MPTVQLGLTALLLQHSKLLSGRRIGLLCHAASVDENLRHAVDLVAASPGRLVCLLGPEHGVRGEAQDMEGVGAARDPQLGIPIYSLYGETEASLRPTDEALAGVDVLVIDLQDVGSRYYTYVWTAMFAIERCAELGIAVIVTDRPNPLGGVQLAGGRVADAYRSFVGAYDVPVRHGMTIGELMRLVCAERKFDVELTVMPLAGWRRSDYYDDTALPWVQPSPNMPTLETAVVYPGGCLLEGTQLSEGRGTTRPFELFGAPWVDGRRLADALGEIPGAVLRPLSFRPMFHKHAGSSCGGVQVHVRDRVAFDPLSFYITTLCATVALWPDRFAWRDAPYEFVGDKPAIDLLGGGPELRLAVDRLRSGGADPRVVATELLKGYDADLAAFAARRQPHLLY
ncbi:MAG: DUF1343 domain-containing protein [Deltaproteobacteria bacterium]|nr:DUF1343 domain-containing protein [Deltaproteobacteria bacterium]